jgi:D-alanyl-D-alanine carboxypeptidase
MLARFFGALAICCVIGLVPIYFVSSMTSKEFRAGEYSTGTQGLEYAKRLLSAYPEHLDSIDGGDLVWRDGTRMALDDGQEKKTFDELLAKPDILDQFVFPYPQGRLQSPPSLNEDPGRIRMQAMFEKMYGDCKKSEVVPRLVPVDWLPSRNGGTLMVTSVNGVAEKLRAVSRELEKLPARFTEFLVPSAGVYNCRVIAGTERKSVHAFGAAIDINVDKSNYWRWTKPDEKGRYEYKNQIPYEIVEIFERHGFIWGGKWYHYDTMHFEYRPELLIRN